MATIEERLAKLEKEVEELKVQIANQNSKKNWLLEVAGSFKNDPDFEEIVRLGREAREAERPKEH